MLTFLVMHKTRQSDFTDDFNLYMFRDNKDKEKAKIKIIVIFILAITHFIILTIVY